jgi:CHRD domain
MQNKRRILFSAVAAATVAAALAGCGMMQSMGMGGAMTQLSGSNEVPPKPGAGSGTFETWYDKDTRVLKWKLTYAGLTGPATAGHIHGPALPGANSGVVVPFPNPITSPMEGQATLTAAQATDLMAGRWYANIHTAANPGGEIRGQIAPRN